MPIPFRAPFAYRTYQIEMDDVATASSAFVAAVGKGRIVKIWTALHAPITIANSALTFEINGVAVTGAGITVAFTASAAGDVDSSEPTANNDVKDGDVIEMITDGGATGPARLTATIVVREF